MKKHILQIFPDHVLKQISTVVCDFLFKNWSKTCVSIYGQEKIKNTKKIAKTSNFSEFDSK